MLIDLTVAFNFVHDAWDMLGIMLAIGFGIMIPCAVVVASVIKIKEYRR